MPQVAHMPSQWNNPDGQDYISAPHRNQKSVSGMGVNIKVSDHLNLYFHISFLCTGAEYF